MIRSVHQIKSNRDGPTVFGVATAIERQQASLDAEAVMVFDLSDISFVGEASARRPENITNRVLAPGIEALISGAFGLVQKRLETFRIHNVVSEGSQIVFQLEAWQQAVEVMSRNSGRARNLVGELAGRACSS